MCVPQRYVCFDMTGNLKFGERELKGKQGYTVKNKTLTILDPRGQVDPL